MTTYNSYEAAKIANPESDIYTACGGFYALGGVFTVIAGESLVLCNPADYCMTVEKFLADGHKFVEGDVYLNIQGDVRVVNSNKDWIDVLNGKSAMDNKRYILRAAALEEKPKPTKFVKVEESIFDLKGEFERGELYFDVASVSGGVFLSNDEYVKVNSKESLCECYSNGNVYRKVEIDWRDELDGYLDSISSLDSNFDEKVTLEFSKSKFAYNMSDDEFVAVCHLVASLTDKPE